MFLLQYQEIQEATFCIFMQFLETIQIRNFPAV